MQTHHHLGSARPLQRPSPRAKSLGATSWAKPGRTASCRRLVMGERQDSRGGTRRERGTFIRLLSVTSSGKRARSGSQGRRSRSVILGQELAGRGASRAMASGGQRGWTAGRSALLNPPFTAVSGGTANNTNLGPRRVDQVGCSASSLAKPWAWSGEIKPAEHETLDTG